MITRNRILFTLGIWIVLQPFLGFPSSYKSVFIIISGLAVVALAFMYARDKRMNHDVHYHPDQEKNDLSHEVYTQSYPTPGYKTETRSDFSSARYVAESEDQEEERYTNLGEIRSRAKTTKSF